MANETSAPEDSLVEELTQNLEDVVLDVHSRHRREKKELQAKIQALKKNAPKSNKKLRKEAMEEVSRLEADMTARHAQEIQELSQRPSQDLSTTTNTGSDLNVSAQRSFSESSEVKEGENGNGFVPEDSIMPVRISKAQKRREKKARESREREERYAAALEEIDTNGPKATEQRKLEAKLKERKLRLHHVPSNGDCLYNAVRHQLIQRRNEELSTSNLREIAANYIETNKDTLLPYMTHPETGDLLTDTQFETYCNEVRSTSAWGGHIELKALSTLLKVAIEVLQADGPPTVQGQEYGGKPLVITYHRHLYSLGEHYNSTVPQEKLIKSESNNGLD